MTYEQGVLTTGTASAAPALEFRAVTRAASVLEMGIFLNAATASIIRVGRPGNTPAGGTVQTSSNPINLPPSGPASGGGTILAGWTTAPTVPAAGNSLRMLGLPGAIGNGIVWTWLLDEFLISPTTTLGYTIWNEQLNSALRVYVKWEE